MPNDRIKVLLVEDNLGDARLLREILVEVESIQFDLVHVDRLEQSIFQLRHDTFDVILLDLSLPDSQGLETLSHIKDEEATIPIVVLTGLDDEILAIKAVQSGAQDYLIKGRVTGDMLARAIRYAIERKRVQEELRQQRDFLDAVVETASEGIAVSDERGQFIIYNSRLQDITGYSQTEAQQFDFLSQLSPNSGLSAQAMTVFQDAFQGKEINNQEWEIVRKGGERRSILVSTRVLSYDSRSWLLSMIRDISDRRRAEQKIREQAALIDIATDAILVQDLESRILFWSKGAERLYGWTVDEAIGQHTDRLLQQGNYPEYAQIESTLRDGEWQGELHHVTRQGHDVVIESRWTLMLDEAGAPRSVLVVNTDITERKQLEAQFLRAQRMESLGILASGIAHDLNNVMTPILAASQLLQMKLPDEKSQQLLTMQEENIKRGAGLIRQVLSFARGIDGKFTLLQIRHLLGEIRQIVIQTFPKSISLRTDAPPDLWMVSADPTQLHQVLINLCVNARDAMPYGGVLTISAQNITLDEAYTRMHLDANVGDYVMIRVADTGMGIPFDIQDRIFEPFFTTKEIGKGTGLGLSTAVGIIRSHHGFIQVYSEVDRGTEFRVYLPAVAIAQPQMSQTIRSKLPPGHGELVLVVDDEKSVCDITKTLLETHGYRVITAQDGIEALSVYTQNQSDINAVLVDMMMPNADGPTTIRSLQAINPRVKIVAVSGLSSNRSSAESAGTSVKAFLPKPYTAETLLKTLHDVLPASTL
ncbi:MAG TPA: response regulator [Elainellaceae cyanobacterium]